MNARLMVRACGGTLPSGTPASGQHTDYRPVAFREATGRYLFGEFT